MFDDVSKIYHPIFRQSAVVICGKNVFLDRLSELIINHQKEPVGLLTFHPTHAFTWLQYCTTHITTTNLMVLISKGSPIFIIYLLRWKVFLMTAFTITFYPQHSEGSIYQFNYLRIWALYFVQWILRTNRQTWSWPNARLISTLTRNSKVLFFISVNHTVINLKQAYKWPCNK